MGLFGRRRSRAKLEQARVALYACTMTAAEAALRRDGHEVKGDPVLRARLGKLVASAMNRVTLDEVDNIARHPDQLGRRAGVVAQRCREQFIHDLTTNPPQVPSAKGEARYGPNWRQVEFFLANIRKMTVADLQSVIEAVVGTVAGPAHPAKQRMQDLKDQARYVAGETVRRLGLADQVALAEADLEAAVQHFLTPLFAEACRSTGIYAYHASEALVLEVRAAGLAAVVGSANLETPFYAALASSFVREILGREEYEKSKAEFEQLSAQRRRH